MSSLGIVGHEAAKFTPATEAAAREVIRKAIVGYRPAVVVSGGCHLGGVDIWAAEIGHALGVPVREHLPKVRRWAGYRERNLLIAQSDVVLCIVVRELPPGYTGLRFPTCYHCRDRVPPHVKSGGCWTAWKAARPAWSIVAPDGGAFHLVSQEAIAQRRLNL